ncbi:aminoglycoside phosphotransferase family protein [Streptomyces sp. NPDC001922]|uniref:aminoglycoside phosphotransferase family protein n=1 Tax=Streptomyces sp. NPDC001922 TaxID=3364624 RepID=UPI003686DB48
MEATTLHADEVRTDAALVRRLVAGQFPDWAGLPVRPLPSSGTDHRVYRLGDALSVRMPRVAGAVKQAVTEAQWLPVLAPRLPLPIPAQVAVGRPDGDYPFDWSVHAWLPGEAATPTTGDTPHVATALAEFVTALRAVDTEGAPLFSHGSRGGPLAGLDASVRRAVAELGDRVAGAHVLRSWEESLTAEPASAVTWIHGDLLPGNLLLAGDRLSSVIDFGCLGVGDPAVDLLPAWNLFTGPNRAEFRARTAAGPAAWLRGRGWALAQAVTALPYYWDTDPAMVRQASHALRQVLADTEAGC